MKIERLSALVMRTRTVMAFVGVVFLVMVLVILNARSRPPLSSPFPSEVTVKYLGKVTPSVVGTSVFTIEPEDKPNVAFRAVLMPKKDKIAKITQISIVSSDRAGRWVMGGRWDTYNEGTRGIGIVRNGKVLNAGRKRDLSLYIGEPTSIDLYIEDGGMTSVWKYFTLMVEAEGGYYYRTVLESGTWRPVSR